MTEINKVIGKYDTASQLSTAPTLAQIAELRRIFLAFRGERTADIRRGWSKVLPQQLGQAVKSSGCQYPRKNCKAKDYKATYITILSVTDAQIVCPLLFPELHNGITDKVYSPS